MCVKTLQTPKQLLRVLKVNFDRHYRLTAHHCFACLFIGLLLVYLSYVVGLPLAHELFWMYTDILLRVWDFFWCIFAKKYLTTIIWRMKAVYKITRMLPGAATDLVLGRHPPYISAAVRVRWLFSAEQQLQYLWSGARKDEGCYCSLIVSRIYVLSSGTNINGLGQVENHPLCTLIWSPPGKIERR